MKVQYGIYVIYKLPNAVELRQCDSESRWGTDMIKAVIFDMDGTLVDTERLGIKAWKAGAAELGLAIDDALIHQFIGRIATRRFATRWSRPIWSLRPAPPSA